VGGKVGRLPQARAAREGKGGSGCASESPTPCSDKRGQTFGKHGSQHLYQRIGTSAAQSMRSIGIESWKGRPGSEGVTQVLRLR
jgi:hypothetical protein